MRAVVLYDSVFGNTKKIAEAIAKGHGADCPCLNAGAVSLAQLSAADLVIVGSPTRGFAATPAVMSLLKSIAPNDLAGKKVAAFDTRMILTNIKGKFLRKLVDMGGYAAPMIQKQLISRGGTPAIGAEGFFVEGEQGPLAAGELERAEAWGKQLL